MARLLLVDDDISEISAVKRVLSRSGHAPLLATNGSDALASVGQARPDLLIVGATCEGGEAIEALRQLEEDEATRDIPLLLLGESAAAPERAVQLPRPVDPAALAEQVKLLLAGGPAPRSFERRVSAPELPGSLERRSGPSDPALARKAAAEALLARARELRGPPRSTPGDPPPAASTPAPSEAAAGLDALFELGPPAGVPGAQPARVDTPVGLRTVPRADTPPSLRALSSPARAAPEPTAPPPAPSPAPPPAPPAAPPSAPPPRAAPPPAPAPPAAPPPAPPPTTVVQLAPPARSAPSPTAPQPAAPPPDWERNRAEERAARRRLEDDLRLLREQLEADRRRHDEELHTVIERATAHEQAALERQASVAEAARKSEVQAAATRAAAEALAEAEARIRAETEADFRAVAEAEAYARAEGEVRDGRDELRARAAAAPEAPPPAELPTPWFADLPPIDPAQEAARRRALSRRAPSDALPPGPPDEESAWSRPAPAAPPAELRGGQLDDLPMPRLLTVALSARVSGRLDVVGDASRALWFEDGRVVGAASNAAGERLDEVALRLGLLTREQYRQVAGAVAGLATRRAAVLLVDRGYLKSGELTSLVRARTEEVVFGIFGEPAGRFRWVADLVPSDERTSLDRPPLALAVEGVRRRWLAPRTEAVLGGPATLVTPVHGGPGAEELGLLPQERRALAIADGLRTLDEVLAASPLDTLSTRQLLAALVLVGAVGVKVVQAGRPAAQVATGIDLARVKEKLEQVRRADYFTILGLGGAATPHEVRSAAERLTAEFQPERFRGHQEEGLPARLEEIRRVVADAREVLADPFLREEYQRGLAS